MKKLALFILCFCSFVFADLLSEAYDANRAGNYQKAAQLFRISCDDGKSDGCLMLGYAYSLGQGLKKSEANARNFWEKGCKIGSSENCIKLGDSYFEDKNNAKANLQRAYEIYNNICKLEKSRWGCSSGCVGVADVLFE